MGMQERISELLQSCGATHKSLEAYGHQVVVLCYGRKSAEKVAAILKQATFRIRGIVESWDDNKVNRGTILNPTGYRVFRVFAHL